MAYKKLHVELIPALNAELGGNLIERLALGALDGLLESRRRLIGYPTPKLEREDQRLSSLITIPMRGSKGLVALAPLNRGTSNTQGIGNQFRNLVPVTDSTDRRCRSGSRKRS